MDYYRNRAWLEVNLDAVVANYKKIQKFVGSDTDIIVVVKSDAYGLGAIPVAKILEENGCSYFAAAYMEEAINLRESGCEAKILVLGMIMTEYVEMAIDQNIEMPVSSLDMAKKYGAIAKSLGKTLKVHISADVGMSRFGIRLQENFHDAVKEAVAITKVEGLEIVGVLSHMTGMGYEYQREFDLEQLNLFKRFTEALREEGIHAPCHCACSAITILYPEYHMDYIRVSALPFGLQSKLYSDFDTEETITLKTKVWYLKDVPIHATIGYGPHYAERNTKIAIIPLGFGDGLHRSLSHCAPMLVNGIRVRVIGKLCMDFTMLDVTDVPDINEGDLVTVFGGNDENRISVQEYAKLYSGTACEVSTSLGKRINRIYIYKGAEVKF